MEGHVFISPNWQRKIAAFTLRVGVGSPQLVGRSPTLASAYHSYTLFVLAIDL